MNSTSGSMIADHPGIPRRDWPWKQIAVAHKIPVNTLRSRYAVSEAAGATESSPRLRKQQAKVRPGARTALQEDLEKKLAAWLDDRSRCNMTVSKHLLHLKAAQLLHLQNLDKPDGPKAFITASGKPSQKWFRFRARHSLTLRAVNPISALRGQADMDVGRMDR